MSFLQSKTTALIIGSIFLAFAGWYVFLRDTAQKPLLKTDDLTTATEADKQVVETLLQLRAITLSGTIFSDPAFLQLKDTGVQIVPEPVGRPNPFLPIAGTTTQAAAAAKSQTQ